MAMGGKWLADEWHVKDGVAGGSSWSREGTRVRGRVCGMAAGRRWTFFMTRSFFCCEFRSLLVRWLYLYN